MKTTTLFFLLILFQHAAASGGSWQLLQKSIGISAMHMQLLHNDRVVMFDRTDFGISNISLPNGKCRVNDKAVKVDCSAHSVEYDVVKNTVRPLMVQTNVWCSSGAVMPDGTLVQAGGFGDGVKKIREIASCSDYKCDWVEKDGLKAGRWYATSHNLPGGGQIIIGGRREFNYEFYPKNDAASNLYSLPFLVETFERAIENNLYPFVFLNTDGFLFLFANNRAILLDYTNNKVVKTYPTIPGGEPRNYPSTGSAVLLPLKNIRARQIESEVLVCGGAPNGSYIRATKNDFKPALDTCARIKLNDPNPVWVMETMPIPRTMGDMILLPNGHVCIINGGSRGSAGWEYARDPVFNPVVYKPDLPIGSRFAQQNPSTTPRMYHSTAALLRDGRVLVGGSNPHRLYNFTNVLFPTDLSLEAFSPEYLEPASSNLRPRILTPATETRVKYNQILKVSFSLTGAAALDKVAVTMVSPSFTTHSFAMNQRLIVLPSGNAVSLGKGTFEVTVTTPGSANIAPLGYYLLFVVHQEVPSEGIWVKVE